MDAARRGRGARVLAGRDAADSPRPKGGVHARAAAVLAELLVRDAADEAAVRRALCHDGATSVADIMLPTDSRMVS